MPIDALPVPHEGISSFGAEGIIPVGATMYTLTFGPYTDLLGATTSDTLTGKLYPVDQVTGKRIRVVHLPSGQVILPDVIPVTIVAGGTTVGPLPHTGQSAFSPFFYRVEWNLASGKPSPGNKTFAVPPDSGSTVDFDLLGASAEPGIQVSTIATSQALIGLDVDGVPFYDPNGVGSPAGIALDTDGVLYLTP